MNSDVLTIRLNNDRIEIPVVDREDHVVENIRNEINIVIFLNHKLSSEEKINAVFPNRI